MSKGELIGQVIYAARENSIGAVLFHHTVAQILGLNITDVKCLDVIMLKGSASPTRLAEMTGLTTGATTAMLDRLERAHLVQRRSNPNDRRGVLVTLTEKSKEKLPTLFAPMAKSLEALTERYSENDLKVISQYLNEIVSFWKTERHRLRLSAPLDVNLDR